jgi:APA family basic amino acid/polyamine antiporter
MKNDRDSPQLVRGLGLLDSTLLVMGIIIGSGIFLTTGVMAEDLPSPTLLMAAWMVGGLLTLAGALTYAELGAAMPEAGGQYIYLRESYGPLPAFLFSWITFLVYQPGTISAVMVGFAAYLGYFVPGLGTENVLLAFQIGGREIALTAGQTVAAALILALTAANVAGLRWGSLIQNVFTFLKVAAIATFVLFGFLVEPKGELLPAPPVETGSLLAGFGVALIAVLFAFDGWVQLTFSAGEIKNPERTLPRALILGTSGVTLIYLLMNAVYLHALGISEMRGVTRVAEKAATSLFGEGATRMIAAVVLISTFGAANGTILTGARVYYATARDGLFFRSVGKVHPRFRTPHVSLWVQGIWSALLALSGRFDQLFTYAVFASFLMYAAATASVFTLRRKRPDLARPYRVWGYPVLPAVYLAALGALALNTIVERPMESLSGLLILLLGVPVYFFWKRRSVSVLQLD